MQFSEKIQEQLFLLANNLVKNTVIQRNSENENVNRNIIFFQNPGGIEKTR